MTELQGIHWESRETGVQTRLPGVVLTSGTLWRGLCVEQTRTPPGEVCDSLASGHLIPIRLYRAMTNHTYLPGMGWTHVFVPPGNIHVLPAGAPISGHWAESSSTLYLQIQEEFLCDTEGSKGRRPELPPAFNLSDSFIVRSALALREDVLSGSVDGPVYGDSVGAALVAHLLENYTCGRIKVDPSIRLGQDQVQRVIEKIHADLSTSLTLDDLAAVAGIDRFQLLRAFRKHTGTTPHQFIVKARLDRARRLLERTDVSITEIALSCGFASASHFATSFRRVMKRTAQEYRRAIR